MRNTRGRAGLRVVEVKSLILDLLSLRYVLNINQRDFPGGAVVKTPHSQCRGPRFNPWSGN